MKLLIINGSSCSGKSTIVKNIMKKRNNLFHLSSDSLKWSFSDYKSAEHYEDVQKIVLAVGETVLKMNYDIISDSSLYRQSRENLINLANRFAYEVVEINLEADFEVLSNRFNERVASALATPNQRISNLSRDRFVELYNIFNQEKNPQAITFRTDVQSPEEISQSIINLL